MDCSPLHQLHQIVFTKGLNPKTFKLIIIRNNADINVCKIYGKENPVKYIMEFSNVVQLPKKSMKAKYSFAQNTRIIKYNLPKI